MDHARSSETETDRSPATPVEPAGGAVVRQVGQWLRDARTRQGWDLHAIAEELRIRREYLEALEEGNLAAMPGRPYALGFLRGYAVFLGLDGDDLVRRVKAAEGGGHDERPELTVRTPIAESRVPRVQLLMVSLLLVGALYGGWRYVNGDAGSPAETVAEVPAELREAPVRGLPPAHPAAPSDPVRAFASESPAFLPPMEADAGDPDPSPPPTSLDRGTAEEPAVTDGTGAADEDEGETVVDAAPVSPDEVGAVAVGRGSEETEAATGGDHVGRAVAAALMEDIGLPADDEPSAPAASRPHGAGAAVAGETGRSASELLAALDTGAAADRAQGREGRTYGRVSGDARVRLEAVDTSWIQVRSADGTYTYTRTLQPGDVYLVPNRADLALWTGNAGGLRVVVDGRSLPALGRPREVRRDIPLDPEELLAR